MKTSNKSAPVSTPPSGGPDAVSITSPDILELGETLTAILDQLKLTNALLMEIGK